MCYTCGDVIHVTQTDPKFCSVQLKIGMRPECRCGLWADSTCTVLFRRIHASSLRHVLLSLHREHRTVNV